MSRKCLFIDYEYCTGCHSCEIACQVEHNLPVGQFGIVVNQVGPWPYGDEQWQYTYFPTPTDQCDLCEARVMAGKEPTCVKHCQANVMKYGTLEELLPDIESKSKVVTYALGN